MRYLKFKSEYDKFPKTVVKNEKAYDGYEAIIIELNNLLLTRNIICLETYPGVDLKELKENLINKLAVDEVINVEDLSKDIQDIDNMISRNLTNDRVFGLMSHFLIKDFYKEKEIETLNLKLEENKKKICLYGFGASLIKHDALVYFDMLRWEIQLRFREGMPNWHCQNYQEDNLRKYKRGFFIEWRTADRLKKEVLKTCDFYIDTSIKNEPKMISGATLFKSIKEISKKPFRLQPYFDPGVWGGQWMKEVCNLDPSKKNYAWSFDGVPEENSINFEYGDVLLAMPSINVVFFEPENLLGSRVYGRFGTEYPIRFDFLDTMEGGNLSLQVHPLVSYIQDQFGMNYTQDESYYILDAKEDAVVYLGVKPGVNPGEMINDLLESSKGLKIFDDEKYINKFKAHKHDHFLIPAGTIHCSGKNAMVLEISATPYIFTFKLWDWNRLGLDGLPRPVHIHHGKNVIQYNRDTKWVEEHLINHFRKADDGSTITGLDERELIETRRYMFSDKILIKTNDSVNTNNLVEGRAAIIEALNNEFEPFIVHYAETYIVPKCVEEYYIKPFYEGETCGVIKAYVR